jgi:DHA1 family tetracycline resistance protein-like MFS transporter
MQNPIVTDNKTSNYFFRIMPLYMVILLDVMGLILVMPILTPLILPLNSTIVPAGTSLIMHDFLYGVSISLYPLFMFFSTPILGDLSDKFGRKMILILCLLGSVASYLIAAYAIVINNLFLLLLSRAVAGLAAGTQSIATAAIIDLSTPLTKTRNLAWVVFAGSVGIIVGPAVGGILADKNLVSWFSYEIPFLFAAAVSIINAIILFYILHEKPVAKSTQRIHFTKGFTLFLAAFSEPKFRLLSLIYFCFILAWSFYYQTIGWIFMERYHYSVGQLGMFIGFIGIIFAITTSLASRYILRMFSHETKAFALFIFLMFVANSGCTLTSSAHSQWFWVILNASSDVICYTLALSIFSNLATKEAQGWIMGVTGAIGALTWTVGGLVNGPLGYLNLNLPLWSASALCLISFGLMQLYHRSHVKIQKIPE